MAGKIRNWLGTFNNPLEGLETEDWLKALYETSKAKYVCGQLEKGNAEGTVHVQFFINFKEPARLAKLMKLAPKCHWEEVKVNNGAHTYCMKEETRLLGPYEFGIKPV